MFINFALLKVIFYLRKRSIGALKLYNGTGYITIIENDNN